MKANIDFKSIDYLKIGNSKQKRAYEVLTKNRIMDLLKDFDPILVGTIPIEIDLEQSDLDIICYFENKDSFENLLKKEFGYKEKFKMWGNTTHVAPAIIANFFLDAFEIEIFGQNIPTEEQMGYRHMLVEHKLLEERGETFRQRIRKLKAEGYKTEPAFAFELGLEGDPYEALLELER
ncbi:MAG: DUF4269 domain-containing protein [Spirochaetota bacterium]